LVLPVGSQFLRLRDWGRFPDKGLDAVDNAWDKLGGCFLEWGK
jgi:hypothetical protein